jgi:DNA-binding NtrC family response regulator
MTTTAAKVQFSILIVDDDEVILKVINRFLMDLGYTVETTVSGLRAIEKVSKERYDLVLLDYLLPDVNGVHVLKEIKRINSSISVLMMTGFGKVETAVEAMKSGADDYLLKPFKSLDVLAIEVEKIREYRQLREECNYLKEQLDNTLGGTKLIGRSKSILDVHQLIRKVAPLGSNVLIEGESGTGKELIARAIHNNSNRSSERFVVLNCGAIPPNLLESELFGYERGAFTGAVTEKGGYFEVADGGTIFLDEISEMNLDLQVKLLRVIQERKFHRIGGREEITTDLRILTSTNRNLEEEVANGRFRKDLYYRINVIRIKVSPLRDRREDIPLLSYHFMKKYAQEFGKKMNGIAPRVMSVLMNYKWDGNVRELENVIEHAVAMTEANEISVQDIPAYLLNVNEGNGSDAHILPFDEAKRRFERNYLEQALESAGGNIAKTSRITAIPRQNIYEKIKKYSINPDRFRKTS